MKTLQPLLAFTLLSRAAAPAFAASDIAAPIRASALAAPIGGLDLSLPTMLAPASFFAPSPAAPLGVPMLPSVLPAASPRPALIPQARGAQADRWGRFRPAREEARPSSNEAAAGSAGRWFDAAAAPRLGAALAADDGAPASTSRASARIKDDPQAAPNELWVSFGPGVDEARGKALLAEQGLSVGRTANLGARLSVQGFAKDAPSAAKAAAALAAAPGALKLAVHPQTRRIMEAPRPAPTPAAETSPEPADGSADRRNFEQPRPTEGGYLPSEISMPQAPFDPAAPPPFQPAPESEEMAARGRRLSREFASASGAEPVAVAPGDYLKLAAARGGTPPFDEHPDEALRDDFEAPLEDCDLRIESRGRSWDRMELPALVDMMGCIGAIDVPGGERHAWRFDNALAAAKAAALLADEPGIVRIVMHRRAYALVPTPRGAAASAPSGEIRAKRRRPALKGRRSVAPAADDPRASAFSVWVRFYPGREVDLHGFTPTSAFAEGRRRTHLLTGSTWHLPDDRRRTFLFSAATRAEAESLQAAFSPGRNRDVESTRLRDSADLWHRFQRGAVPGTVGVSFVRGLTGSDCERLLAQWGFKGVEVEYIVDQFFARLPSPDPERASALALELARNPEVETVNLDTEVFDRLFPAGYGPAGPALSSASSEMRP